MNRLLAPEPAVKNVGVHGPLLHPQLLLLLVRVGMKQVLVMVLYVALVA